MSAPVVSVVAVTYSSGDSLGAFLDSLETATTQPYEVVLADNGSSDDSIKAAITRPHVRVIETGGNLGYGQGTNVGVAAAEAGLVVIANPDIVWDPGSLDQLISAVKRWPDAGSFGPLIRTPTGEIYPSAVVAVESVDRVVPTRARRADRARGRLAVGVLPTCAAFGLRCRQRLRPGVFHVLRGPRPR
jgi:GT2 family glycosyltransferase